MKRKLPIESRLAEMLTGMAKVRGVKQMTIAHEWGCSQPVVSSKLKNGRVSAKELLILMKMVDATDEDWERLKSL